MSGFCVFYIRSASLTSSWPFLLAMAAVFIGNEYMRRYHARLVFSALLLFFALYSYAIMLVPVIGLLIPTMKIAPSIYPWLVRRRIFRWYKELRKVETGLGKSATPEQVSQKMDDLDHIAELAGHRQHLSLDVDAAGQASEADRRPL